MSASITMTDRKERNLDLEEEKMKLDFRKEKTTGVREPPDDSAEIREPDEEDDEDWEDDEIDEEGEGA